MPERPNDRLTGGLEALGRVPVDASWTDVERRIDEPDGTGDPVLGQLPRASSPARWPGRGRRVLVGVAVLTVGALAIAVAWPDDGPDGMRTGPASTSTSSATTAPTSSPEITATTLPSPDEQRTGAAEAWTGTEYLVWGGQGASDGTGRADGWRYDPATGATRTIPVAPIAPRDQAAGAWTGEELIVCCGRPVGQGLGYDTASAAAYDPEADTWRTLAKPPPETNGYTLGAVWTGTEVLVVSAIEDARHSTTDLRLFAYDPAADTWSRRTDPLFGDRIGHLAWSGTHLVAWTTGFTAPAYTDQGQIYDPVDDTWTELPPLPGEHRPTYASAVWAGDQFVVWGNDQTDDTAAVGYRWRRGDESWRPMAPAPIAPVSWGEWTPGSQSLGFDERTGRVIVVSLHRGDDGTVRPLLAYDPVQDDWTDLGTAPGLGYSQPVLLADDLVLQPARDVPIAFRLSS